MVICQFSDNAKDTNDLKDCPPNWRKYISNFTRVPVSLHGKNYPSPEHAFQGLKTSFCSDAPLEYCKQFECGGAFKTAQQAKTAGGKVAYAKEQEAILLDSSKWNVVRFDIMKEILEVRMKTDDLFYYILKATQKQNMYLLYFKRAGQTSYWGGSFENNNINGQNILGKLMMYMCKHA